MYQYLEMASTDETREGIERLWNSSATIADFFKRWYLPRLEAALSKHAPGHKDAILKPFARYFEPWPDWVLNISVELLHVYLPTVQKVRLHSCIRFLHTLLFELRLDGSSPRGLVSIPTLDPELLGAVAGHLWAMGEHTRQRALLLAHEGLISRQELAGFEQKLAVPAQFTHTLADYLRARPGSDFFALSEALVAAKGRTFDHRGGLRETTATKVYRAIFDNWPEVECLAGPTELCRFLEPVLAGSENDPEKKLDRVKKICARMGITFKPAVKGQTHPCPLSLPESA